MVPLPSRAKRTDFLESETRLDLQRKSVAENKRRKGIPFFGKGTALVLFCCDVFVGIGNIGWLGFFGRSFVWSLFGVKVQGNNLFHTEGDKEGF